MLDSFCFETFADAQSAAFQEYLSAIVAKLAKEDEEYRAVWDKIEKIYEQYPKVMGVCDAEQVEALSEQECKALIEVMGLQRQLVEMEQESVYFRGCYDSVGYLKKAGIL